MSERTRGKSMAKVRKLLPGTVVRDYVPARSGMQPLLVGVIIVGSFLALAAAMYAATGGVFFPGWLILLGIQHLISPPRALVVCDRGIAVTDRSFLNGRPSRIVALADLGHVQPLQTSGGQVQLQVGSEQVWLPRKEEARLRSTIGPGAPAWAAGPVPQPYA